MSNGGNILQIDIKRYHFQADICYFYSVFIIKKRTPHKFNKAVIIDDFFLFLVINLKPKNTSTNALNAAVLSQKCASVTILA